MLGEEEVMFAKGNKMIPLVRDWRELSKGVLGVDYQGKEGKGSEVGAIAAHPVLWPLLSPLWEFIEQDLWFQRLLW